MTNCQYYVNHVTTCFHVLKCFCSSLPVLCTLCCHSVNCSYYNHLILCIATRSQLALYVIYAYHFVPQSPLGQPLQQKVTRYVLPVQLLTLFGIQHQWEGRYERFAAKPTLNCWTFGLWCGGRAMQGESGETLISQNVLFFENQMPFCQSGLLCRVIVWLL